MIERDIINGKKKSRNRSPLVFILILNWNGWKDTAECIESLRKITYDNFKIVVIDNGSKGKDVDILADKFGNLITLIRINENLGYAEGNNVGIRYSLENGADYILLLNNDTIVAPDFLEKLISVAENQREFGIIGPMIYYYPPRKNYEKIWCAGGSFKKILGYTHHLKVNKIDEGQYYKAYTTDYVPGCAMLIKREVLSKIGMLDKDFFAYFEDLDFNLRARASGFLSVIVPHAHVWHKVSKSTQNKNSFRKYLEIRNRIIFARKHLNPFQFYFIFLLLNFSIRIIIDFYQILKKKENFKSLRGLLDGLTKKTIDEEIIKYFDLK